MVHPNLPGITLPPPSWGQRLAARLQGLSLMITAGAVVLLAVGKFDNALSTQQKNDLLHGFYLLDLLEQPNITRLNGSQASANNDQGRPREIAYLSVPNNYNIINYSFSEEDNAHPVHNARVRGDQTQVTVDDKGVTLIEIPGEAGGFGGGNSSVGWHVWGDVTAKYEPLTFTLLGKGFFGIAFFIGLVATIFGVPKKKSKAGAVSGT